MTMTATQLSALAEVHYQWVLEHEDGTTFDSSRGDDPDYNVWHVDIEADPEAQAEFVRRAHNAIGGRDE